jgi:integrase
VILLGPPAQQVLSKLPKQSGAHWVFPAEAGVSHFQGVEKVWRKARDRAGLRGVRIHDLRHSFASAALASGDALPVIGALLGHADAKTTSRYAHLADDPIRAAANRTSKRIAAAMKGTEAKVFKLRSAKR